MSQPPLSVTAQRLYDAVAPMAYDDEANGWALALFCQAMALPLDEAADLSRDEDDGSPGYSGLFDPDTIPAKLLPWLGQLIGVTVPTDQPEAVQRARIKSTDGFQRGTPGAIIGAAQAHLTGTQTVYLTERSGSAYQLTVSTLTSETPDAAAVLTAITAQKPAGIVLTHRLIAGGDWNTLIGTHATWADVSTSFATWGDVLADPAHI